MKISNLKSQISNLTIAILSVFALCAALFALRSTASAELTAKANHDHITIDFLYHGSTVSVRGVSDPDADLIIRITSPEGKQMLKKKGRAAGILWMNVGSLEFENTPGLYFLRSTKKVEDILNEEDMNGHLIGYPALEKHAEVSPVESETEKAQWFGEFIKFKESSKLFLSDSGHITFTEKDGKHEYYTQLEWPYQAPPGDYTVTVYSVKDKKVIETAESSVNVEQVGGVKSLATLAKNNGALYGVFSILVALGAGFGVGLIFRKGGGSH